MKLQFEQQGFQIEGVRVVVNCLAGQAMKTNRLTIEQWKNYYERLGKLIAVIGSRGKGTAGAFSDWDSVIEGSNNKGWRQIKNSLHGSKSVLDNTPRNIDIF